MDTMNRDEARSVLERALSAVYRKSFAKRAPTITRDLQARRVAAPVNWLASVRSPPANPVTRDSVCRAIPAANSAR